MLTLNTNLKYKNATTQYTNFDFNSVINFNGKKVGIKNDGVYELGSNDDNLTPIDAYFIPLHSDFGIMNIKRMRYLYIEGRVENELRVSASCDNLFHNFTLTGKGLNIPYRYRHTINRNVFGTFWKYIIGNVNGGDFSINRINGLFVTRSHGVT